jgi:hypothetical protein
MDQLIFRSVKPNTKFLERSYGVHARLIHDKKTLPHYGSWMNYVTTSQFRQDEQH